MQRYRPVKQQVWQFALLLMAALAHLVFKFVPCSALSTGSIVHDGSEERERKYCSTGKYALVRFSNCQKTNDRLPAHSASHKQATSCSRRNVFTVSVSIL